MSFYNGSVVSGKTKVSLSSSDLFLDKATINEGCIFTHDCFYSDDNNWNTYSYLSSVCSGGCSQAVQSFIIPIGSDNNLYFKHEIINSTNTTTASIHYSALNYTSMAYVGLASYNVSVVRGELPIPKDCINGSNYTKIQVIGVVAGVSNVRLYELAVGSAPHLNIYSDNGVLNASSVLILPEEQEINLNQSMIQNNLQSNCNTYPCNLNFIFETNYTGNISLNSLKIKYTPSYVNALFEFPIEIKASSWGNLTINSTEIYFNGTANYTITANYYGNSTYDPSSDSQNLTVVFSGYNLSFAQDYIEFIPQNPSQQNVTPYGQSSTTPIINLTSFGYEMPFYLYMKTNETHSCVNDTIATSSNKSTGIQLTSSYQTIASNVTNEDSVGLWAWADYGCDYTTWKLWLPTWDIKTCCRDCVCQVN